MRAHDSIRELIENFKIGGTYRGVVSYDEPIAPRTTFQIGGSAPFFFEPADKESFVRLLRFLAAEGVPQFILGGGSNIVVSDSGFEGAVVSTAGLGVVRIADAEAPGGGAEPDCALVECGAGASVASLVEFCTENELSGAERFAGLPGSVGGALYM
ncbi:MAG: FAD-binding protein, partial [Treponemataceae bacterium]|nr:FAD-binding protein [Treponemataceae bacterium]